MIQKNKRGSIFDVPLIMIILFTFAMVSLISYKVLYEFDTATNTTDFNASYEYTSSIMAKSSSAIRLFDKLFIILLVGSLMALVVSAFFIQSHPIFAFISFLFLTLIILVSVILSNVYEEFEAQPDIAIASAEFPITSVIMDKLPIYVLIAGILVIIATSIKGGSPPI